MSKTNLTSKIRLLCPPSTIRKFHSWLLDTGTGTVYMPGNKNKQENVSQCLSTAPPMKQNAHCCGINHNNDHLVMKMSKTSFYSKTHNYHLIIVQRRTQLCHWKRSLFWVQTQQHNDNTSDLSESITSYKEEWYHFKQVKDTGSDELCGKTVFSKNSSSEKLCH